MSEEQIKELEEVIDMPRIEEYILQLQQENKELKETLKGTTHCFDEEEHQKLNYIITEFEKWLEEKIEITKIGLNGFEEYQKCLDKLQELKKK